MALWTAESDWIGPCPNRTPGGMGTVFGLVLHIQDGNQQGSIAWFRNPAAKVSSHWLAPKRGRCVQMVDTADKAWCQSNGNLHWLSLEFEGHSGDSLTPDQVESAAQIFARVHTDHGVPLQATNDPNGRGLGFHAMGGAAWGGHDQCPGAPIIAQRGAIIDRARQILNPTPEAPNMSDSFFYSVGGEEIFLYAGGQHRHLLPAEFAQLRAIAVQAGLWNNGEVLSLSCHVGAPVRGSVTLYSLPGAATQEECEQVWATNGLVRWHVSSVEALEVLRGMGDLIGLSSPVISPAVAHVGSPVE